MQTNLTDISEYNIFESMPDVLDALLRDQTLSGPEPQQYRNIRWLASDYADHGAGYQPSDEVMVASISGPYVGLVEPALFRSPQPESSALEPTWQINARLNAEEREWMDGEDVFNAEQPDHTWAVTKSPIRFKRPYHRWRDYVKQKRVVAGCGEGASITSRYDTTTGCFIPALQRVGILDRKLRVVTENCRTTKEWLQASGTALCSIYAYALRGDEVLLTRQAMLYTLIEWYLSVFGRRPQHNTLLRWARFISWNVWQMDASTLCVPEKQVYCLVRNWGRFASRNNKFTPDNFGYNSETYYEMVNHQQPEPLAEPAVAEPEPASEPAPAVEPEPAPKKKASRRKKKVETQQEIDWDALF